MSGGKEKEVEKEIGSQAESLSREERKKALVLWFKDLHNEDVDLVGGKNASLGEMFQELNSKGINVPNGFAVTAHAYRVFMETKNLKDKIRRILSGWFFLIFIKDLDTENKSNLEEKGQQIRDEIMNTDFPKEIKKAIKVAYRKLEELYTQGVDVAVRSSATSEDLPTASFAGQQDSFLNIKGYKELLLYSKKCIASLFTNRAISYREDKDFDHLSVALSIGVQKMVRSDRATSGVMFTLDTESGFRDVILVTASYGLGENIVQGAVSPDEFLVFKPTLKKGFRPIIQKILGSKEYKLVYGTGGSRATKNEHTPKTEKEKFCLSDDEVLKLAEWGMIIEDHYSRKEGKQVCQDIEWAYDGIQNELYVVQSRPETVHSQKKESSTLSKYVMEDTSGKVLIGGVSVGSAIGAGEVHILTDKHQMHEFEKGQVLVTDMTDPDMEPIITKASAIVTNRGGRTCHAAIVSRELNIPCVIGCVKATSELKGGADVTVDCSGGDVGKVWEGKKKFRKDDVDISDLPRLSTKITLNVTNPGTAFSLRTLPNDGVGLLRMEFTISNHIKAHPMALLHLDKVEDPKERKEIEELCVGYPNPAEYFVSKLAQGIAVIAAAFYPKQVILRFSDFKTDEYRGLLGGTAFEPKEANPMLGWRGASRYYHENYKEGFGLECKAVKKVREEFGLENLQLMIPFCRTVKEAERVIETMKEFGLKQHENNLKVYAMCELPSNIVLAEQFLDIFDGFSIGSNDLTQLVLGLDRNSEIVNDLFDERNESIEDLISHVIRVCNRRGKYVGICGQAPSDYPEFADFLVEEGIQSLSLNADSVVDTMYIVSKAEKQRSQKKKNKEAPSSPMYAPDRRSQIA